MRVRAEVKETISNHLDGIEENHFTISELESIEFSLESAQIMCHTIAKLGGWWSDPKTGEPIERNKAELLRLIHSELYEVMEGVRKDLMDDKLPDRKMEEVELADAVIRIFDYAGAYNLDISGALIEKLAYNISREDHKPENRRKEIIKY